ncbi:hypothetical protein ACIPF8_23580 [Collimonas sp. NPDC087041]|uniref:hypothetical protein n=1 Tax=Collimonas sp. NPDC087041 TaxID=3363960 RepID=UPI0037FEC819
MNLAGISKLATRNPFKQRNDNFIGAPCCTVAPEIMAVPSPWLAGKFSSAEQPAQGGGGDGWR